MKSAATTNRPQQTNLGQWLIVWTTLLALCGLALAVGGRAGVNADEDRAGESTATRDGASPPPEDAFGRASVDTMARGADEPEFHTFSICAIDPAAGQCGVAVTTRVTLVGRYVPWVRAGVGAVATQATTAVKYGRQGLDLVEAGNTPGEAIEELLKDDPNRELRQLGIIDMQGRTAAFTGRDNGAYAGSRQGKNCTVQGNLLVGPQVIDAVAHRFEETEATGMALADRLIAALEAGQAAGGDKRKGRTQSAALVVADSNHEGVAGDHIVETLQVAEHPEPVGELRRQYNAIHERLGYRTFSIVRGADVVELKRMLYRLKLLWPELAEFPNRVDRPDLPEFDTQTAAAVDRFRKLHGLPVPDDQLGYPSGLVDAALVNELRAAYQADVKQSATRPAVGEEKTD